MTISQLSSLQSEIKSLTNEIEKIGSSMTMGRLHQLPSELRAKMKSIHNTCNIHVTYTSEMHRESAEKRLQELKMVHESLKNSSTSPRKKESIFLRIARSYKNKHSGRVGSTELYDLYRSLREVAIPKITPQAQSQHQHKYFEDIRHTDLFPNNYTQSHSYNNYSNNIVQNIGNVFGGGNVNINSRINNGGSQLSLINNQAYINGKKIDHVGNINQISLINNQAYINGKRIDSQGQSFADQGYAKVTLGF